MPAKASRTTERRRQLRLAKRALARALELSDIPDALHKAPELRDLLCRSGRHDFELLAARGPRRATLECMYCGARRGSERVVTR
jgi:hypothetical protein